MVTVTYASTVNPTSVNDITAYERNIVVMQQLYICKNWTIKISYVKTPEKDTAAKSDAVFMIHKVSYLYTINT